MKRKFLFSIFSILLLFTSCVSFDLDHAVVASQHRRYDIAFHYLTPHLQNPKKVDPDVIAKYQEIWNQGQNYYLNSLSNPNAVSSIEAFHQYEDYYFLQKHYMSLSPEIRQMLPNITMNEEIFSKTRKNLIEAGIHLSDILPAYPYKNRLQKFLILQKTTSYSPESNPILMQKFQKASADLERKIKLDISGSSDYDFRNFIQYNTQNIFLKESIFEVSNQNAELVLKINIENYQFLENQSDFSTLTEYLSVKIPYETMVNGKIQKKYKAKKIPYQKIAFSKKSVLSYTLIYELFDKHNQLVFSGRIPSKITDLRKWNQYLVLDSEYANNVPKSEKEPQGKSREKIMQESFQPVLNRLKSEIQSLQE